MPIRFPKTCKTKTQKSQHASYVASVRWDRHHAAQAGEPVRTIKTLLRLQIQRVGIDSRPIPISIVSDGLHRRSMVVDPDGAWARRYGRKALVRWFNNVLKSAGV